MTITGRLILLVCAGSIAVWLWPYGWTVFWWFVGCVTLAIIDNRLAVNPAKITYQRPELPTSRRDEPRSIPLVVTNTAKRAVTIQVRDAWQPSVGITDRQNHYRLRLAAGHSTSVTAAATPFRRGHLVSDHIAIRVLGPLGLAGRQQNFPGVGVVSVLPPFRSRKHLPGLLKRLKWVEGQVATRLRGGGTEFDSLREYVHGDDVRSMDWRATARAGKSIVRTWRPEQDRRILVVIDTSRLSAVRIGDEPRLDAFLDTTLLLSSLASAAHDRVDVIAVDNQVRMSAAGVGRTMTVPHLMKALAPVHANLLELDWDATLAQIHHRCKQHALVVVLTAVDGGVLESPLLRTAAALRRRHGVVVGSVRDAGVQALAVNETGDEDIWTQAGAMHELADGDAVAAHLRRMGVACVTGSPDSLPKAICDLYLDLKLRGEL